MILDEERETASRCVIVLEHPIDWRDGGDLVCNMYHRVATTLGRLDRGCWFFLPGFTVFAADPSQEFFACVDRCVRRWRGEIKLCTFHKELGRILRQADESHRQFVSDMARDGCASTGARGTLPPGGPVHRRSPGLAQHRPDEGHADPRRC